jgi:hypothetical protein
VEPAKTNEPVRQSVSPAVALPRLPGTPELLADGSYSFSGNGLELVVDPRRGGSAVTFAIDGKNVLTNRDSSPSFFGSAFWPSPRSVGAEAPPELDHGEFVAELEGTSLVLSSAPSKQGFKVVKRYRLDTARRAVEVSYQLLNVTDRPLRVAPWEVHRVPLAGGLTFYPSAHKLYPQSTLRLDAYAPVTWFTHDHFRELKRLEAFADGAEGWLAHAHDGLLLVKVFDDAAESAHAPGEAEIEIAIEFDPRSKDRRFVRLSQQGAYVELPPGAASVYNCRWFLRRVPAGIALRAGNPELLGFVRGVIY